MRLKRLVKLNDLNAYNCEAADGKIGPYGDIYFDASRFAVRFLVVNTQEWLTGRKVLLSPFTIGTIDEQNQLIYIELDRQQIRNSPPLGADQPVTRRYEEQYFKYYGWPPYWDNISWPHTRLLRASSISATRPNRSLPSHSENHLHRASQILGYGVAVAEGRIGKLSDFVIDTHYWVIRYMEIDTRNYLNSKKYALITPSMLLGIDWPEKDISVDVSRKTMQNAPPYDVNKPISRDYESRLLNYYGEVNYWK
jgi:hypothetical protein